MGIKLGNIDAKYIKVGNASCKIYLGNTLLYPQSPTPPTPTLQWVSYSEGDTVPSSTIYGVKLVVGGSDDGEIDFGDSYNGIAFICENGEWTALNIETGEQIDISSYYDEATYTYTILFSDLGYSGMPISYPQEGNQFEFDVDLYEEYTPTLQWVAFSAGDTIPQGNVYGFKGNSQTVGLVSGGILEIGTDSNNCVTFGHGAPTRAPQFTAYFYLVSNGTPSYIDSWDYGLGTFIFSDYASNGVEEYYYEDGTKTIPFDCQLYIYA